jgi:hypothetical protein
VTCGDKSTNNKLNPFSIYFHYVSLYISIMFAIYTWNEHVVNMIRLVPINAVDVLICSGGCHRCRRCRSSSEENKSTSSGRLPMTPHQKRYFDLHFEIIIVTSMYIAVVVTSMHIVVVGRRVHQNNS